MDIVERLREQIKDDHIRGCQGREYHCNCGYDLKNEGLMELAADEIERLEELLWQEAGNRVEIERLQELLRGVGANRYWEGRWRDEAAENERLRAALRAIGDDPEAGVNIALYVKASLGSNP